MSNDRRTKAFALSGLASEVAAAVVDVAGDIVLVVGRDGVIRDVVEGSLPLQSLGPAWVGRLWADMVSADTRAKATRVLDEACQHGRSRRRELNHPGAEGTTIPVSWAAVRLGEAGPLLIVGRDLRAVGAIQQRFVDVQKDLERDYWRRREADAHYRLLFQVATDAVLVLEAATLQVVEANPAAAALLDCPLPALCGADLRPLIAAATRPALDELLLTARASGHAVEIRLSVAATATAIDVSATPFRADARRCLLLRARLADASDSDSHRALDFIGQTPDAVVVTESNGRVRWANPAFVELCGARDEARVRGRPIAEAVGDAQPPWATLLARVRDRGIVGGATVTLYGADAPPRVVDVSAALMADGDQEQVGFTLRMLDDTAVAAGSARPDLDRELARDLAMLAGRLGPATLPELLAEAARVAELHLIRAALHRSGQRIDGAAGVLKIGSDALLQRMADLGLPLPAPAGRGGMPPLVN